MEAVALTKEQIHNVCLEEVNTRIQRLKEAIKEAQEAANNEDKSSAGDKYETGRAMAHIEREKYTGQLNAVQDMRSVLDSINAKKMREEAVLGSVIRTNLGIFYIAVSLGQIKVGGESVFVVSPVSPIGQAMASKKVGDQMELNGRNYRIERIS
ncbi:3-oxoacyl-ACP synthase [Roseivirga sp. BDSF3-8]|uniref:3-oxoacyl-ACP synthase n=1 Tax=Roseivirga sp. BDSF3-8 TaxID=3241598 RepID=UPI00353195FE